jgi:hypothetical protein
MTSGQGGQYGQPDEGQGGQPQGWNAPPPPGQNPPPGQPWPGYAPAPSAPPGYGAPAPVERPMTVRAGLGAFVASLVLGIVATIVTFADVDTLVAQAQASAGADGAELTEDVARAAIVVGAVIALVIYGLYVLFLWFAWKGRNWARIVLFVLGGLSVVSGLVGLSAGGTGQNGFLTSLGVFQLLLTIAGIVLLAMKPSNDWYRFRGWQRATGQG